MADERFKNYLANITSNAEVNVIPTANNGRGAGKISEVHSIYLTLYADDNGNLINTFVTDVFDNTNSDLVDIYIRSDGVDYYIAKAVRVVPNSAFYIEKTITLKTNDALYIKRIDGTQRISVVCSTVDITDSID